MQGKNNSDLLKKMGFQLEFPDTFRTNDLFSGVGMPWH